MCNQYEKLCVILICCLHAVKTEETVAEPHEIPLGFQLESEANDAVFSDNEISLSAEDSNICMQGISKGSTYGYIKTPFYPGNYLNNLTCLWSVTAPKGFVVQLMFRNFQLEEGHDGISCTYDYLHIFEEYTEVSKSPRHSLDTGVTYRRNLGTFCGSIKPSDKVTKKPGSTLYLLFHSDDSEGGMGFSASYRMMNIKRSKNRDLELADEENFIRVLFLVLSLFVMMGVFIGFIYRCTSNSNDFYYFDHDSNDGFRVANEVDDRFAQRRGRISPELVGPPPAYTEVVKTEEDWNRVVEQLGAESVAVLRSRVEAELIQVEYDIMNGDSASNSQTATQPVSRTVSNTTSNVSDRSRITSSSVHLEAIEEPTQPHDMVRKLAMQTQGGLPNQVMEGDSPPEEVPGSNSESLTVMRLENEQTNRPDVCSPRNTSS